MSNLLNEYHLLALGLTYLLHSSVWILLISCVIKSKAVHSAFMENALWKVALVGGVFTTTIALAVGQRQVELNKPIAKEIQPATEKVDQYKPLDHSLLATQMLEGEREETVDLGPQLMEEGSLGPGKPSQTKENWSAIGLLPIIWGMVMLFILLYRTTQHLWFFRQLGQRKAIKDPTVLHIMKSIQRRTKRPIQYRVSASPFLDSPIVIRGREICLPGMALQTMNQDQLEAMVAHEWAHIIRRDHHWALFLSLLNTLFFFQPLHRLAKQGIERTNELLCDQQAAQLTGNALALAECLVAVASWIQPVPRKPLLVAGMALRKSELSSRITQLLNIPDMKIQKFRKLKLGVPSLLLLAVTIVVLPGFRFVSQQADPGPVSEKATPVASSSVAVSAENVTTVNAVPLLDETTRARAVAGDNLEANATDLAAEATSLPETMPSMQALSIQPLAEVQSVQAGTVEKVQFTALPISPVSKKASCADLLRAVKAGNAKLVQELLKSVDPDCTYRDDGEPRSSLVAAARMGNMEITKMLLGAKASVEYKSRGDESPLMAAANHGHLDLVKLFVANGAKVNRKISGDGTALIGAVRNGHYEVAKFLLEKGANPFAVVAGDEYAMYHARMNEDKKMVQLLRKYEDE